MSEAEAVIANPEADLDIDAFIARGNARDRGEELPELPGADASAESATDGKEAEESSQPASADAPATEPAKPDKRTREGRKASIQAEIDELTATKHSTKREVEAARAELERLNAERAKLAQPAQRTPQQPTQAQGDPEPKLEDFKDQADPTLAYFRAVSAWEGRKAYREESRNAQIAAQRQRDIAHFDKRMSGLQDRLKSYHEKHPEFGKSLNPIVSDLIVKEHFSMPGKNGVPLADAIVDSENTGELLEYFTAHFDDFQRLLTLPPTEVGREIGKIETRLTTASSTGPVVQPPPVSKAKPPIKPVGASPVVSDDEADDSDDLSEGAVLRHFKRENQRDSQRRLAR